MASTSTREDSVRHVDETLMTDRPSEKTCRERERMAAKKAAKSYGIFPLF